MKKNFIWLVLLGLLPVVNLSAQVEKEIRQFADSTEMMVNNGKRLINDRLDADDMSKVAEITDYLRNLKKTQHYNAFSFSEDMLLSLLSHDWLYVDYLARNCQSLFAESYFQSDVNLINKLKSKFIAQAALIDSLAAVSTIDEPVKSLTHVLCYLYCTKKIDDKWNNVLVPFKKSYGNDNYKDFIRSYLPGIYRKSSVSFSIGATIPSLTGNLGSTFDRSTGFMISTDFNLSSIYLSLSIQGSGSSIRTPMTAETTSGSVDFSQGDQFRLSNYGLLLGYFLIRNDHVQLAPYFNVGACSLISDIYPDAKDDDKEVKVYDCFSPGFGLHAEYKLFTWGAPNNRSDRMPGYLSFRCEAGLNYLTNMPSPFYGHLKYVNLTVVWGMGDF
ncbi:MAG: hypothetical protein Q8914_04365 [Bacteroidota bacterium]|nr:hypothetical protein [Bacteroidota bacterium]